MAEPPALYLHPGYARCGSSSIQQALFADAARLQRQGIYLPDARFRFAFEAGFSGPAVPLWYFNDVSHGRITTASFERRLDGLLQAASDRACRALLVSSENLCRFDDPGTAEVHRALAGRFARVELLYYLRRQDDLILSSWVQWAHKSGRTLADTVDRYLPAHSYLRSIDGLAQIYPQARLQVVPLHPTALHGGELVADLYQRIGLEPPAALDAQHANRSLNPWLCDILARVPEVYGSFHDHSVRALLEAHVQTRELLFRRHPGFMPPAVRQRIMDACRAENLEIHRRFFPQLDFDTLFGAEEVLVEDPLEGIKEVLAVQMQLLLGLLQRPPPPDPWQALRRRLDDAGKRLWGWRPWG